MRSLLLLGYVQTILLINVGVFACISEGRIWLFTVKIKHWRVFKEQNQAWNVLKTFPRTSKKGKSLCQTQTNLIKPYSFLSTFIVSVPPQTKPQQVILLAWLWLKFHGYFIPVWAMLKGGGWGGPFPLFHPPKDTCALAVICSVLQGAGPGNGSS